MGFFDDIGLLYSFAIILGGLITVAFVIGFLRLYCMKRQFAKHQARHDMEIAEKATKRELGNQQELGEGDLFGARAIEKGFYGGVAQSQPNTATNSPSTSVDGDGNSIPSSSSSRSSSRDVSLFRDSSQPDSISRDASTVDLRLQPSEAELTGRINHDPSIVRGTYTPNVATKIKSLAMTKTHSKPASETSTPSDFVQTNQVQIYA